MRKLIVIAIVLGLASNASAVIKRSGHKNPPVRQHHEVAEAEPRIGFYLAPVLKVGEIRDDLRAMVGIRGGLEINRSFYVGLAGYGLPKRNHDQYLLNDNYDYYDHHHGWDFGYGGLEFGVITGRPRTGQLSFGVLIGGGSINEHPYYFNDNRGFFVMEPQLDFSANLSRNVRLSVGGGYRFVDDVRSSRYTEDDLQGFTMNFAIAFGIF